MKTSDRIAVHKPYPGGNVRIPLSSPAIWYGKYASRHFPHITLASSQIDDIMLQAVHKTFGQPINHDQLEMALRLDCFTGKPADVVFDKLTNLVTLEVLKYFPRIGGELPESFYNLIALDLYIYVPTTYEEQRGYFF